MNFGFSTLASCTLSFFLLFEPGNVSVSWSQKVADFQKCTVFSAGDDCSNSYRIPSVVTAKDGTLLVFCEARWDSWRDKSRTDIVLKRSADGGKTWFPMQDLTKGTTGAYMDPTPIVDDVTGRIFLFTSFWPEQDHSGATNKAVLLTSDDHGVTWNVLQDVTSVLIPQGKIAAGFGPGSGLQMKGDKYKGRLVLPLRMADEKGGNAHDVAAYSDNHGVTWEIGGETNHDNEFQIAESPLNTLICNARVAGARMISRSIDGGCSWSTAVKENALPGVSKGCQSSVIGIDNMLYYSGIQGIEETDELDERAQLTLYKSIDGGQTWNDRLLLYNKASGYSCIAFLPDGQMAIIFETADTNGFTRKSIPDIKPLKRPAGWMRLDLIIIPTINL